MTDETSKALREILVDLITEVRQHQVYYQTGNDLQIEADRIAQKIEGLFVEPAKFNHLEFIDTLIQRIDESLDHDQAFTDRIANAVHAETVKLLKERFGG